MQSADPQFPEMKPIDIGLFVELHKKIGLALWAEQSFEFVLCHFIALALKLPPSRAEAEMLEVLEKLQKQTLGALMKELSKANSSSSITEFDKRMEAYLEDRNWLVHRSWREHHTDLFTPEKLAPLFARLETISRESESLRNYFANLVQRWTLNQEGVTEDRLNADALRRLKRDGVVE
jgi:hypothetical protein